MLYQMSWSLGHNSLLRLLLALQTITNTAHFDQLPLFFFFFEDRIKASSHTKENWMSVKCLQIPWKHHFTVVCRRANFFLCNKLFQVLVLWYDNYFSANNSTVQQFGFSSTEMEQVCSIRFWLGSFWHLLSTRHRKVSLVCLVVAWLSAGIMRVSGHPLLIS